MEMPEPSDAHRRLERLTGVWEGEERMLPSQWTPEGSVATGRTRCRVALGGFAAIADYEQVAKGRVVFTGHGVYRYDAQAEEYVLDWFDCFGGGHEVFRGNFEGDTLVMTSRNERGLNRLTWDYGKADSLYSRMESSQNGEEWALLMEAQYTRSG